MQMSQLLPVSPPSLLLYVSVIRASGRRGTGSSRPRRRKVPPALGYSSRGEQDEVNSQARTI